MKLAIVSDIHANLPALRAVLADMDEQGVGRALCLGDVVGYGPHPTECIDLIRERCEVVVCGNHDEALLMGGLGFHVRARDAIRWTKAQLEPGFFSGPRVRERWDFVTKLALRHEEGGDLFLHGSPEDETSDYLMPHEASMGPTPKLERIFGAFEKRLFLGHTHFPMVMTEDYETWRPEEVEHRWLCRDDRKVIINVGSVGQPRDRDPRACYVIVDGPLVMWRRVSYPVMETVEQIRAIEDLHPSLAERLIVGQ